MTYPLSTDVQAGDTTAASQYNNLRRDALYLGENPNGSAPIRDWIINKKPQLSKTGSATIAVQASAAAPVSIEIEGKLLTNTQTVTLTLEPEQYPTASGMNAFAADNGTGGFTLTARVEETAATGEKRIAGFAWTGTHIVSGSFREETGSCKENINGGILTLQSGTPVSETDVTGGTLYYTPYAGNTVTLYDGSDWQRYNFEEISLSLSGMTTSSVHDIFLQLGESGPQLTEETWTSDTRQPGTLQWNSGILVSGGNIRKKYIGTIGIAATGITSDSQTARLIWNEYNRRPLRLGCGLDTLAASATAGSTCWKPYYEYDAPEVIAVIGTAEGLIELTGVGGHKYISPTDYSNGERFALGICRDMNKISPYSGNTNGAEYFTASCGNDQAFCRLIRNDTGMHRWTLAAWSTKSTTTLSKNGDDNSAATPGIFGIVR